MEIEAEKEEQKIENIELEGEGIPRRFSRSEDYLKGYKAGWFAAKTNLLKNYLNLENRLNKSLLKRSLLRKSLRKRK
ncbi:hypothetical protein B9Q01_10615 [Candidatus Marsarchaeota G1 archaeon OSP_D]|uniref:Uncharacterized protein n=1 Tax=Candidatus Marsarchaeota G1 archaeon OSP_D TaxID=1978155 RepID=A0A2R6A5P2_9ARCH|nr:MAG: hypothetical protein B9Q01_10615 [Candidatus Marsarchaeota G1 archaeon OSP_D]